MCILFSTSAKKAMLFCYGFIVVSFVLIRIVQKMTSLIFMKLGGRVKHGPRKNPVNFSANLSHGAAQQI